MPRTSELLMRGAVNTIFIASKCRFETPKEAIKRHEIDIKPKLNGSLDLDEVTENSLFRLNIRRRFLLFPVITRPLESNRVVERLKK